MRENSLLKPAEAETEGAGGTSGTNGAGVDLSRTYLGGPSLQPEKDKETAGTGVELGKS